MESTSNAAGSTILCFIENLEAGGAQRQLIALATMLQRNGYKPVFVTYFHDNFYAPLLSSYGIRHVELPEQSKVGRITSFWKVLASEKPDAVFSYSESASMILCVLRAVRRFRLIVSERNTTQEANAMERLRFQLYRLADHVVSNSTSQAEYIKHNVSFLASKTVVINNFLDTSHFKPGHPGVTPERRMLVLARITPQKNTKRFIQAIKGVKDDGCRLTIDWYGQSFEPYHTECLKMVEELGVGDMFHIHPAVSKVEELYGSYDALCLPSLFEGFPNVVGEAMSCALPVVCSDVCDNRLIVGEENGNILYDPCDTGDIKAKIEQFCHLDSQQLKAIGQANRERAVRIFDPGTFESQYLKLLQP